jgi:multiple antibiotic resistance protein
MRQSLPRSSTGVSPKLRQRSELHAAYLEVGDFAVLLWTSFLAFTALLPIINPLGSALVFLGLLGPEPPAVYRSLARRIAINNIIFLAIIELLGSAILKFFGISLPIVQVSGGLVIMALGWSVLNQQDAQARAQSKKNEADACLDAGTTTPDLEAKLFYPFTFPVTSGPGTLVVTLTLSAHDMHPGYTESIIDHLGLFLAIVIISVLVYFCYAFAPRITRAVSQSTSHGILRVMGFIVVCIGAQIGWNGALTLLQQAHLR